MSLKDSGEYLINTMSWILKGLLARQYTATCGVTDETLAGAGGVIGPMKKAGVVPSLPSAGVAGLKIAHLVQLWLQPT